MNLTSSLRYCCRPLLLTAVLMLFGSSSALGQSLTSLRFSFDDDHYIEAKAFLSDSAKIQTTLVMLHGTPGSWQAFSTYLSDQRLRNKVNIIAVNRVGFGEADKGELVLGLPAQAKTIEPVLQFARKRGKVLLLGHSLGGSIAAQVAADYKDLIDGVVLVAATIDPKYGAPRWYNRVANSALLRWLIPKTMRMANDEIIPLQTDLEKLAPRLSQLVLPVSIIQGDKDYLVSPKNAASAEALLSNAELSVQRFEEEGHFILWENQTAVIDEILRLTDQLELK